MPFSVPANVTLRPRSGHVAVPYGSNGLVVFGGVTYNRAVARVPVATNDVLLLKWGADAGGGGSTSSSTLGSSSSSSSGSSSSSSSSSPLPGAADVLQSWTVLTNSSSGGGEVPVPRQRAAAAVIRDSLWVVSAWALGAGRCL